MKTAWAAALLLLVPAVVAQEIQVDPSAPSPGDPVLLQTTVVGNVTWDFGDGHSANGRTVSHTFPYAGIYHVTVYQGSYAASEADITVRIPDALYLDSVTPPTNTSAPPPPPAANGTHVVRTPPGGLLHYLTENPLILMLSLGAIVGGAMAAIMFVRKRRAKGESYDEDEKPSIPAEKKDDKPETPLEDLLPGAEELPEPEQAEPPPEEEAAKEPEEADPMSLAADEPPQPKKPAPAAFDPDRLLGELGGST